MLRVGRIPYLNCEPFFHRLEGARLVDLIPRVLGQAMAADELDAGPLSLMDYVRLESRLVPLPYGIGCPTGARRARPATSATSRWSTRVSCAAVGTPAASRRASPNRARA